MLHIYIALGLGVIGVIAGLIGRSQSRKTDAYGLYVEASRTSELAPGVPGFYGGSVAAIEGQPQLTAPYSKQPCVWFSYVLERERQNRDANGVETVDWEVISQSPPQGVTFTLQATGGVALVDPTNANVDKVQQYQNFVNPMDTEGETGAAAVIGNVANALSSMGSSRTRVTEHYIALGQQLYAGGVPLDQNGSKLFASDQHYPLVLTSQSKADLVKSGKKTSTIKYAVGGLFIAAALSVLLLLKK